MAETKTSVGFFDTQDEGHRAVSALLDGGIPKDRISFLAGDTRGHETPAVGPIHSVGGDTEAGRDAWIGALVGLIAGVIAFSIPGLGMLIAAGPLAGAIGGLGVGAAVGGVVGLLRDHGVSEDEAEFYAEGVKRGGALVMVTAGSDVADKAAKIMKDSGAIDVEKRAEEWRAAGWTGGERVRHA